MRELKECTAEVFRRGEQRLRERRRKRNRLLALCVPVCLIAAVWSVMSQPGMIPELGTAYHDRFTGEAAGSAPESLFCPYVAAEIQAGTFPEEHYGEVTDRPAVAEMFSAVDVLFSGPGGNGQQVGGSFPASEPFPEDENSASDYLDESANKRKDYTITFTAGDGSQAVYLLSGNVLVNVGTSETVRLSDAQAAGLAAALGIPE